MTHKAKKQIQELVVCVDTHIINTPGVGASVLQMCETLAGLGVRCTTGDQLLPNTVTWQLSFTTPSEIEAVRVEEQDTLLALIPQDQFISMVHSQLQKSREMSHDPTLTDYVQQLQQLHPGKRISLAVHGMEKYFNDQKLDAKRKHRETVTGQKSKARSTQYESGVSVTRFQVEEAVVLTHLEAGCCCRLLDTAKDVADFVKCYTKAVLDKPSKKDRFDSVFSFLEEGGAGVKADKTGAGLLKVWRLQLQQLHNLGPDMAIAITAQFPSPTALKRAYAEYPNPAEAWKVTENIVVRRGAGALETGRRVGQQLSRRIHLLMTSTDPNCVIK